MKCPKCNTENPDTSSYCADCGTQLIQQKDTPAVTKTLETPFPQLTKGTSLAKRYKIIEELGKGGMGEVHLAEDTNLKRQVAIKVLPQPLPSDGKYYRQICNLQFNMDNYKVIPQFCGNN